MRDAWSPSQYERFRAERRQPFLDLLALVRPRPGMRVVDLGCGTGEPTRDLHRNLRAERTAGVERSEAMLGRCRDFVEPGLVFERGDIATWTGEGLDLVFSNAALHWVPGHEELLARLTAALAPGGQLAVQMPMSSGDPPHRAAAEIAGREPYRAALAGWTPAWPQLAPEVYAELLDRLGYEEQHVRLQIYAHHLESRDDVLEWLRGTLLTAYEQRLPAELFTRFQEEFRERLRRDRPDTRPHFFPYKRLLLWARLPESSGAQERRSRG